MMSQPTVRVLLVEDSPSDAALVEESLTQSGLGQFEFTHVETLAEAMRQARQANFDVSLLDLTLPDSSGRETFLRARAEAPALPIVVMTSIDDEAIGLEAVRHGIQDYLIKGQAYGRPTARSIRYAIERKRSEEALKQADAALQQERAQLEEKVRERTAELSALNQVLQAEILQRQRAEDAHQLVRRRLSEAQETERGRISRELHDRLGQDLTALKLGLQNLRRQGPFAVAVGEGLGKLETLAEGLMRDIHRLAWELRPSVLDDLGLDLALQRAADQWSRNTGVPVDLHTGADSGTKRLPQELETTLYRIAQEALTNVARHAQANRVSLLLERRSGYVSLIVEDDGRGFDAQGAMGAPASPGRLGLLGMQERVRLAGGTLTIESSPGAGATVFARLPLEPRAEGRG
ncbi:MAG: response regulator [Verrucomicrobiota bacterium]|jgi:signal transduction histidine kinase